MKELWNTIKVNDDPVAFTDENKMLHPWFANIFKIIIKRLGVNVAILNRPRVSVGGLNEVSPDFLIGPLGLSLMSFLDSRIIIELNRSTAPFNSAISDSTQYLGHALSYYRNVISIACNALEIQALWVTDEAQQLKTRKVSLFTDCKWKSHTEPTKGFKLLCNILSCPVGPPKSISINGELIPTTGTMFDDGTICIYTCIHGWQEILAQIAIEKREFQKYKKVLEYHEMQKYVVPEPKIPVEVMDGFAMMRGTPLYEIRDLETLKIHLQHAFQGIQQLHALGFYHLDLRPSNFVIYDETCRLIDWATMA